MFVLICCTAIFGILGLIVDAGLMMSDSQNLQAATDAAATAGAMDLPWGNHPHWPLPPRLPTLSI